ncbi:MAG: c-type cytochrome [Verrucomicrobiaceae bacterium]|nr:c-type cytochrome [Verrucomicrobiaceae bacterium]
MTCRFIPLVLVCTSSIAIAADDFPAPFNTEKLDPRGPMPAEEVARTMELPKGFHATVFAAEPDVQQPIAMNWDAKGRLWVAENYTYAENPKRWDTTLRDRIIILEDKDNDGKHDGRKVFWDKGSYLTSVEVGYGGVWILNDGKLEFIADKNGDDIPDGEPEVLLDGFNVKTIGHNIVNGLRWGPDGWLYGRHGITDTSSVGAPGTPEEKRVKMNCAIWRYHPTRKVVEVVCHGGTNSWGHDWNADGELFWINTVIGHLWHGIPGAYYDRMFGSHLNPHVYETIKMVADHYHFDIGNEKWSDIRKLGVTSATDALGGGHAHVGLLIYQGGAWPKEYDGAVLACNLHGNRINMDRLEREGCGYVAKHAPDFMKTKDKWFRGIDLLTCPDGNIVVSDWSDTGECHDSDGIHRTSGRIYKISYGEPKKMEPVNLAKMKDEELVKLLDGKNSWRVRGAGHVLSERQNVNTELSAYAQATVLVTKNTSERDKITELAGINLRFGRAVAAARMMNTATSKPEDVKALTAGLDENGLEASQSARWIKLIEEDMGFLNQEGFKNWALETFLTLANSTDTRGLVRLHLASALQRLPLEARWPIAAALAKHEEDANDRQQPLMIWYGIEPAVAADPAKGVELIAAAKIPTVRRLVVRRITEDFEKNSAAVDALVALATTTESARDDILRGMSAALKGVSQAPKPKGWDELVSVAKTKPSDRSDSSANALLTDLSVVFGSGRAIDELIAIVKDADGDANARISAMDSLLRAPKPELFDTVRGLINDKVLGTAARLGLVKFANADVPKALLNNWPDRSIEWRTANVSTLVSRAMWAKALLDYTEKHPQVREDITPSTARQIRNLGDDALSQQLTKVWGELRDTPAAKKEELAKWTKILTPESIAKADPAKGRTVFAGVCGACHKLYGQGGAIGPDLTGGNRHQLAYLLENLIDPSAVVPADYRVSVIKLKDGRVLTGVIPEQNERSITVQSQVERVTLERDKLAEQTQLAISLMPEGQLTALGEEQARNLIAYLMSNGQVDLPK